MHSELKMGKLELVSKPDPCHNGSFTIPFFWINKDEFGIKQSYSHSICSAEVYNGRAIVKEIPLDCPALALDASVESYLKGEGYKLIRRIVAGYSDKKYQDNFVKNLSDDAGDALYQLVEKLAEYIDFNTIIWPTEEIPVFLDMLDD